MIPIFELTLDGLTAILKQDHKKGGFHASALYREVFKQGKQNWFEADEFVKSPALTKVLLPLLAIKPDKIVKTINEEFLTKFITRLSDGQKIESVIIPMTRYKTLCISCQVGCKMGCRFCETGRMGFKRNLSVAEIISQVYNARFFLKENIQNVVFMGMGEPFDNFDNVIKAIEVMNVQQGLDIASRHITISTAGLSSGIDKLAALKLKNIRLAVSINAANDEVRSKLMPVNRRVPLKKLKTSLTNYPLKKRGAFLMEYVLIKGVNDSFQDAQELVEFIGPLPVRLNLIGYNPVKDFDHPPPSEEALHRFGQWLTDKGIFVIKRWSKGRSVSAGCGQLGGFLCE
ncbi:MAG: 23S rRNA (adenine(2503)-C(2))-methyltransferase RlmN [Desulfobacteraceae bacterium]|nr:23S rRNA (adenine(2503)-C(2))-methyltransferase RlmN [Desulfobacteraceae bacterium]